MKPCLSVCVWSLEVLLCESDEIGVFKVFTQGNDLLFEGNLVAGQKDHEDSDAPEQVAVEIGLRLDVWWVGDALSLSENLVFVKATKQEGILTGQSEHVELIFVVVQSGWALSERRVWRLW